MARILIEHDADLNAKRPDGSTPLYYASLHGKFLQNRKYLEKNIRNDEKMTVANLVYYV